MQLLERFQAKWIPVRVKKTRQNKKIEPRSDSIGTEKALAQSGYRFSLATNAERVCAEIMLQKTVTRGASRPRRDSSGRTRACRPPPATSAHARRACGRRRRPGCASVPP